MAIDCRMQMAMRRRLPSGQLLRRPTKQHWHVHVGVRVVLALALPLVVLPVVWSQSGGPSPTRRLGGARGGQQTSESMYGSRAPSFCAPRSAS